MYKLNGSLRLKMKF